MDITSSPAALNALDICNACDFREVTTPNPMGYCNACIKEMMDENVPKGHRNEAGDYIESPEEYAANFKRATTFTPEQEAQSARARKALGWNAE